MPGKILSLSFGRDEAAIARGAICLRITVCRLPTRIMYFWTIVCGLGSHARLRHDVQR